MATVGGCTWIIVLLLEQITFQHGKKTLLSEDQVVQDLDAKNIAFLPEPSGYILVLHARLEIAAGVVVGHYNGSGSLSHCFGKDFHFTVDNGTISISMLKKYLGCTISFIVANK